MRIDLATIRSTGYAGQSPSLLADWRVGAILQATALRDARTGDLWLQIADMRYPARVASGDTSGPANGERLTVRVLRSSPVLALETLSSDRDSTGEDVTADALRRYLPRQISAAPLASNLAWIANGKSGAEALPAPVTQAAARLWHALPDSAALTNPKGLETAITRSGAFLESTLAGGDRREIAAAVTQDIKALMLNLARVLKDFGGRPVAAMTDSAASPVPLGSGPLTSLPAAPATLAVADTPPQQLNELARQTDGALARMTALQAGATHSQDTALQSMVVELPVRHGDRASVVRLRIEQDRSRKYDLPAGESWTVEAAMDLGVSGGLHAKVMLQGQRIGVQMRAESATIVETLIARAPELESMLRESGLEVDRVVCLHGLPAGEGAAIRSRLLDVRA